MRKVFSRLALCMCLMIASMFIFCGCEYKKYEFIGIVDPTTNEIKLKKDLTEEELLAVEEAIGDNAVIQLKEGNKFIFSYTMIDGSTEVTFKQKGTYTLSHEEKTIIFHFPNASGTKTNDLKQQYENGKIIYFTDDLYLVFK